MADTKTQEAIAEAFTGMSQNEQDRMMAVLSGIRGDDGESEEQYFTNVTKAMQAAGWNPAKRAKAGVKAWWNNKVQSGRGSGIHSRASTKVARFLGLTKTADFVDRWLTGPAKPKKGGKKKNKKPQETASTTIKTASTESGSLVGFKKQLDLITGIVQMTAEDVTDIKSLLMPKGIAAKNKDGDTQFAQFNPLAPQGEQFHQVSQSGKLMATKPSKEFQNSAQKKAAFATAELAMKIFEKDKAKAELRKKYEFKDEAEQYKQDDPLTELRTHVDERLDKIEKKITDKGRDGIFGLIGGLLLGLWKKIKGFMSPIFGIVGKVASAIGKVAGWAARFGSFVMKHMWGAIKTMAGIVRAVASGIGRLVAKWFPGLSIPGLVAGTAAVATTAAIGATIDKGMKQVADKSIDQITSDVTKNQERAGFKPEDSYQAYKMAIDKALQSPMNATQERQDYIKQQLTSSEGLSDLERRMAARYYYEKEGGKKDTMARGRKHPTPVADSIPAEIMAEGSDTVDTNYASTPVAPPPAPQAPAVGGTGTLLADGYEQRIKALGDVIAAGESGGDYNIYNKGTIGKNKGKIGRADLSAMSIAEYLRRAELGKDDPQKMFAVGKYQIIPDTMRDAIKKLGLDPNSTKLDPETQERIFKEYLTKSRRPKIHAYLTGKSDDLDAAIMDMAKEWASVGVPHDTYRGDTLIRKGQSYYSGVGGNRAHTSAETIASAVTPVPTIPGTTLDKDTRTMQAANAPSSQTVVVSAPTVNTTNVRQTVGKRPAAKADVLAQDKSLVRTIGKDAQHPVYG